MTYPDVQATQTPAVVDGFWGLFVQAPRKSLTDATYVRGVPTKIAEFSWEDPFGPKTLTVVFPAITIFDKIGEGELEWLVKEANIDFAYLRDVVMPAGYPGGGCNWEGYIESFSYTKDGLTAECKGALYQLDNYQAKPEYLGRPMPYEQAIARQLNGVTMKRGDLRFAAPTITFPSWWTTTYVPKAGLPTYLLPTNVAKNQQWTGLVTRGTGNWEPVLSSYIQTLLSTMYTPRGRWTLDLNPGRRPVIYHQDFVYTVAPGVLVIDPANPGVELNLSQDYGQTANCIYGNSKSVTGSSYSGMMVTPDGSDTLYLPLAQLRQVEEENKNAWYDPGTMKRETVLNLTPGLEEDDAYAVANSHLQHFVDPGLTGTITLKTDPLYVLTTSTNAKGTVDITSTTYLTRMAIKAGMTVLVPGILGSIEGFLFHISAVTIDPEGQSATLTVDTKARDALTVAEVRLRGRDSLSVQRQLIGGQFQLPVNDTLVPWNYAAGSGYIPSGPHQSSLSLFRGMPIDTKFPWTSWLTTRPPNQKAWRGSYIHIGPKNQYSDLNWAVQPNRDGRGNGILVKLAQAASIRLIQIVAVDSNGNPFPVPFHVSMYTNLSASFSGMPLLRSGDTPNGGYNVGQHYPFFNAAWETVNTDGTVINSEQPTTTSSVGLVRAWGTGYEPAGYWPGSKLAGDPPTGMLQDEGVFEFAAPLDSGMWGINPKGVGTTQPRLAGYAALMIYCDAQAAADVYFVGRVYRAEPGGQN